MADPAIRATPRVTLCGVLSETRRIINAQSCHFFGLLILFVFPLSFAVVAYPSLSQSASVLSSYYRFLSSFFIPDPETPPIGQSDLIYTALYFLFVLIFSLFTTASITYSTFHGFFGKPAKFVSSIKLAIFSFFPLVVTYIVSQLILGLVFFAFGGLTASMFYGIALFGVEIDYDSVYFLGYAFLFTILFVGLLIYFQLEWYLANVVVVLESQWGFAPLKRSSFLVKGVRSVAFSLIVCFGLLLGLFSMMYPGLVLPKGGGIDGGSFDWTLVLQMISYTILVAFVTLYTVAANTVLFLYCKALRGELALEILDEFAVEYSSLPMDDGKAPKVVYVV